MVEDEVTGVEAEPELSNTGGESGVHAKRALSVNFCPANKSDWPIVPHNERGRRERTWPPSRHDDSTGRDHSFSSRSSCEFVICICPAHISRYVSSTDQRPSANDVLGPN